MMDFEYESEKSFSNKILSRRCSLGCSSRISYYRSGEGEGVPFKWEMQPGIAKEQPTQEVPPLTPPPALLSLALPKPCVPQPKPSTRSSLRFWKKRVIHKKPPNCFDEHVIGLDIIARLDCSSEYSESITSPRGSSFSSSSSTPFVKSPVRQVFGRPFTFGCFPMHINRVLVSIARRD
ncbi:hypothetical protein RJT34_32873 [Clitoria ternatea]|uniref:Uncharacterized protein n=1 Tax=Clitoria ternatea TaxID=43366 RepID=A0AAN9I6B5_CLITE